MTFQEKVDLMIEKHTSLVVVGLDPSLSLMPSKFQKRKQALFEFCKWIVDETHENVCAYKPNIAFFEGQGAEGLEMLKMSVDYVKGNFPQIPIILDAKRGDVASTNNGYAHMAFDYLGVDAMTIQPYLGFEAVSEMMDIHREKGFFVLCKTSNPGSGEFQDRVILSEDTNRGERRLWEVVADQVGRLWNIWGNAMLVVGATYPQELRRVREIVGEMTVLVPGIGVQGGDLQATLADGLNTKQRGLLINSSRGILYTQSPSQAAKQLRQKINAFRYHTRRSQITREGTIEP